MGVNWLRRAREELKWWLEEEWSEEDLLEDKEGAAVAVMERKGRDSLRAWVVEDGWVFGGGGGVNARPRGKIFRSSPEASFLAASSESTALMRAPCMFPASFS
jgi:endonuclease YncB( thermonuclease family)